MGKKTNKAKETAETIVKVATTVATIGTAVLTAFGNNKKN